ncbi:hypothetical protein IWZ00DRAFT_515571 [Phyllosticta capitalensis]
MRLVHASWVGRYMCSLIIAYLAPPTLILPCPAYTTSVCLTCSLACLLAQSPSIGTRINVGISISHSHSSAQRLAAAAAAAVPVSPHFPSKKRASGRADPV